MFLEEENVFIGVL